MCRCIKIIHVRSLKADTVPILMINKKMFLQTQDFLSGLQFVFLLELSGLELELQFCAARSRI